MFTHFGWGMMGGWGWLGMVLTWAVIILLIVWLVRSLMNPNSGIKPNDPSSARDVLDMRYAHGELTRKEYEQMKKDLSK